MPAVAGSTVPYYSSKTIFEYMTDVSRQWHQEYWPSNAQLSLACQAGPNSY